MPAHIIDGKALSQAVRDQIAKDAAALLARTGIKPGLAAILVGDDPASHLYVKNKQKACEAVGIYVADHKLPASTCQDELLALIDKVNRDPRIHGILVQLPLPKQIDSQVILNAVLPEKDADGFHPYNMGRLVEGTPIFEACTPRGVIKMIESTGVGIAGKRAVVLGRSNIVGKPVALMLVHRHATVTICHSKTKDLPAVCRRSEEHTSELQSRLHLVCRLLLEKKKKDKHALIDTDQIRSRYIFGCNDGVLMTRTRHCQIEN